MFDAQPLKETDLYAPIKAYLEGQGYVVKGEVKGCDVVGLRGDEPPVIVELKTTFGLALVNQGVARLRVTDRVYLACPSIGGRRALRRRREALTLCRRLQLGLLFVRANAVETIVDPKPYAPRRRASAAAPLLQEFERRRGDPTAGGAARTPIMTAYRQDALVCAAHLAQVGPCAPRVVKATTGVARAATILSRDVYGWFVRVERGVYDLTDAGRAAVAASPQAD